MATGTKSSRWSVKLHKFLAGNAHKTSVVTSALLSAVSLFYVFSLGSYLQVTVYFFLKRFTYIKPFDDNLVSSYYDSIIIISLTIVWLILSLNGKTTRISVSSVFAILLVIAIVADQRALMTFTELSTLPVITFTLFYSVYQRKQTCKEIVGNFTLGLTLNYLIVIAVILGIYSILISLSVIFGAQDIPVDKILASKHVPIDNYGYELFILFSVISPLLLVLTFFGLPVRLLVKGLSQKILRPDNKWWLRHGELTRSEEHKKKSRVFYLSLFVLLSLSLALVPQLSTVNKDNQKIGSDSDNYVEWITPLQQTASAQGFLKSAFIDLVHGDRPLTLILLFLLTTIINAPVLDTIEYLPVILGPALIVVVYFFTRELTSNETASLFAGFLTGLGYIQVSMGIYAGFYANWIALLVGYSSLIFFFRFLRSPSNKMLLIFLALLLTMLFSHAYTWTVFVIVMSLFLIVSLFLKSYSRRTIILLLLVVMLSVAIDVIKTVMLEAFGTAGGVKLTISLAQSNIGLKDLGLVWETLVDATQHHFGGIFSNFMILGLVLYWLVRSDLRKDFNVFIITFLMIGIPPLFLGDWIVQSRVFYNIPFQIPAAIALTYILKQKNALKILPPIYIWLIAISIWTVSNFYEVTPS